MTGWTLRDIKKRNLALEGHCGRDGCGTFYVFDVDRMITSAGPEYLVPEILPVVCTECGGPLEAKLAMMPPDDEQRAASDGSEV